MFFTFVSLNFLVLVENVNNFMKIFFMAIGLVNEEIFLKIFIFSHGGSSNFFNLIFLILKFSIYS